MGERYHQLARRLLDAPDPVIAIAGVVGDHEGRIDALVARIDHLEAEIARMKTGRCQ